jgi:predicted TIM-barrel fold metal-dependent hydrolase
LLIFGATALAQTADPALLKYIESIPAIDNHAHVVAPDIAHDKGYDALRCDQLPSSGGLAPANLRFGTSTRATWKALYGTEPATPEDADAKLPQVQGIARKAHANDYFAWVLNKASIATVLANRTSMAPELNASSFRWVPYDDALLFPLDNSLLKSLNPDRKALFEMEEGLFRTYLVDSDVNALPANLDEYVNKVVRPTLQRQKAGGAMAIKFEAAYLRSLNFGPRIDPSAARAAYARQVLATSAPLLLEYTTIQNYIFHEIAAEAGKLGLAVHIHTGSGCGEFFDDRGSDPMLLSSVLNDPSLRSTNFVLLHGGSPFDRHVPALIVKPNVYVDTSVLELLNSPAQLAAILRPWLESMPEHVLFGTDASPFGPGMGWEETTWLGSHNARQAVAIVLTQMMTSGVIDAARAREIADGIFRANAAKLYGIK